MTKWDKIALLIALVVLSWAVIIFFIHVIKTST